MIDGKDSLKDASLIRRSHLNEEDSSEEKIFFTLFTHGLLNMSQIAKHSKMSPALVYYHLPRMVEKGILVKDKNLYSLQPLFYNDEVIREAFDRLEYLVTYMAKNIIAGDELDAWEVMKQNTVYFMSCVGIKREKEK